MIISCVVFTVITLVITFFREDEPKLVIDVASAKLFTYYTGFEMWEGIVRGIINDELCPQPWYVQI